MGDIHLNKPLYEAGAKPSIKGENDEDFVDPFPKLPKVGTAARLAGIVLDRIGFLNLAVREISLGRIAGAVLLVAGVVMIRIF